MTPSASGRPKNTFSGGVGGRGVLSVSGCRVGVGVLFRGRGVALLGKTLAVALVLCSLVARVGALLIRRYSYCLAVMRAARATARTNSCSACSLPRCC